MVVSVDACGGILRVSIVVEVRRVRLVVGRAFRKSGEAQDAGKGDLGELH
jgi:hypothetical protein